MCVVLVPAGGGGRNWAAALQGRPAVLGSPRLWQPGAAGGLG